MPTVGERLKTLRAGIGVSQKAIAEMMGATQSSVNRYENNESEAPYKILEWYADYFDVSLDYIFCRTDNPQGKLYKYAPNILKDQMSKPQEWERFVEACFNPESPVNTRFKEMMMKLAKGEE